MEMEVEVEIIMEGKREEERGKREEGSEKRDVDSVSCMGIVIGTACILEYFKVF